MILLVMYRLYCLFRIQCVLNPIMMVYIPTYGKTVYSLTNINFRAYITTTGIYTVAVEILFKWIILPFLVLIKSVFWTMFYVFHDYHKEHNDHNQKKIHFYGF